MNIVILNNFWRYPSTERWDFELVEYEKWICHDIHQVSYICNARGKTAVTAEKGTYTLYEVDHFNDLQQLEDIVRTIIEVKGPIDRLIAFSENLLSPAASLREQFSISGPNVAQTLLARDKVKMKERLIESGLRAPRYCALSETLSNEDYQHFANEVGFPLILKPVDGASSIDVLKIDNLEQLQEALIVNRTGKWELEEFIAGNIYHVDGLVDDQGKVIFCVASQYINTCLDFSFTSPLGAIMLEFSSPLNQRIAHFSADCLSALSFKNCAFHLELFLTFDNELVFLEVGARVAGADVPYMIEHNTGVNLFKHWIDLILYGQTEVKPVYNKLGAWLMFGLPEHLPQRVVSVTDFIGTVPSIYRQLLPKLNSKLIKEGGYCSLQSGRFLFSNESKPRLTQDVQKVVDGFQMELQVSGDQDEE
ncbi:ATP-grasp domain-containing protein [uncultured Shewanella sp.]|uniref:ATP-grasp domain-containing protein n=1 Tax=uncultured Shewanella sp. TaxID=173975 RepID=UPI00263242A7|nr:ATP-grasp domain-containing protein [uncultured Shewanella sp.]